MTGSETKAPTQTADDISAVERQLFELARKFARIARHAEDERNFMTANVLLALVEARRASDNAALIELERGAHRLVLGAWNQGFATNKIGRTARKERLLEVIGEAIELWLPQGADGTSRAWTVGSSLREHVIIRRDGEEDELVPARAPRLPKGSTTLSAARKMAMYIDLYALRRYRWTGILPAFPKDVVGVLAKVIDWEIDNGRLRDSSDARSLCMKILSALDMDAAARKSFMDFEKQRAKRKARTHAQRATGTSST